MMVTDFLLEYIVLIRYESTIMLRESSQGESSVMRLRLEGRKKPIRGCKKTITNICTSEVNTH